MTQNFPQIAKGWAKQAKRLKSRSSQVASISFGLRILSLALSFILSIILVKAVGADEYGIYVYAFSWITLSSTLGIFGLNRLLIRNVSAYKTNMQWSSIRGLLIWSGVASFILCLLIAACIAAIVWQFNGNWKPSTVNTLLVALLLLPFLTLTVVFQSAIQGFSLIIKGQLPGLVIRPFLFISFVAAAYFLWPSSLSATSAMVLHALAALVAFGVAVWFLWKAIPKEAKKANPHYEVALWVGSATPIVISQLMGVATNRTDVLLLGTLQSVTIVGFYNIAKRLADLVTMTLTAVNVTIAPQIAHLYAKKDFPELQRLVTKSSRVSFFGSLAIALGLILFGRPILSIWGKEFVTTYNVLLVLIIGQVLNSAIGPTTLLLAMTEHEREMVFGTGLALIVNIALNFLLVPKWGIMGTAVASLSSVVTWNVVLASFVYLRLGIYSTALGALGKKT